MLICSKRLDTLAQASIVQSIRLNEQEAPQREIDRLKKQDEDKNVAGQKARPGNKAKFRPQDRRFQLVERAQAVVLTGREI